MPMPISSYLIPKGGNSVFLLEDKYIKGGLQMAADVTERDSIPAPNRKARMLVITQDDGLIWQLQPDLETWSEFKVGAEGDGSGPRQTVTYSVPEIPPASYADFELPLGNTVIVQRLKVESPCLLEIHSTPERVDTNPFRFIAVPGHLEDDGSAEQGDGTIIYNRRYHIWANLEDVPSGNVFFRVLNTDEEHQLMFTVTILFKPIET